MEEINLNLEQIIEKFEELEEMVKQNEEDAEEIFNLEE